jgi:putative tryptophan/tyrosine transport system permease protein
MIALIIAVLTQSLTFLPLVLAIYLSFCCMRATDMTLDGSMVLGAGLFARLLETGMSPASAAFAALLGGALCGIGVSIMQHRQKIDSLLAGVLATFILSSVNLIIMQRPNISLLDKITLLSPAFATSQIHGWLLVACYSGALCALVMLLLLSRYGLALRAFGDNQNLLRRMGRPVEGYRIFGFALTNAFAAAAGCLTAQTIGYADVGMGFGVTLTALGAVILGRQLMGVGSKKFRAATELLACTVGVAVYFLVVNGLLRLDINPVYLKMLLGILLVFFLRAAAVRRRVLV